MFADMFNGFATLIVGAVAYVTYVLGKRNEKKNAAIMVVMDIREAEQAVNGIKEYGLSKDSKKPILTNSWSKYKHLFASDLSYDDFVAFNRFFDACINISDAKDKMENIFYENISAKIIIVQNKVYENMLSAEVAKKEQKDITAPIEREVYTFMANEPGARILKSLNLLTNLSATSGYQKLKRIGGIRT